MLYRSPMSIRSGPFSAAPAAGRRSQGNGAVTGRATELRLLVFAAVIVTGALVVVELNQNRVLTLRIVWIGGGYLAALVLAHLIIRRLAPCADPLLLPLVALLNGLGLVMIYRLDLAAAAKAAAAGRPAPAAQAPAQLMWTGVGLLFFMLVLLVIKDHRVLAGYAYTLLLAGVVFLVIPAVLPAKYSEVNGAQIWIKIPHLFSIQPGEFAKIALIVFAAAFLQQKRTVLATAGKKIVGLVLPRARDLGPLLLALLLCLAVFVRAHDLGQAMLIFGVILAMIYLATARASWLIIGLVGFAGGAYLAYRIFPHVRVRVDIWLHPFADPQNTSYQLVQSLFGLATGGIFGTGLGNGHPDLVPYASTDFISAAIGEELGLLGLSAVLLCYLLLGSRGLRAAMSTKDTFGALLAAGLSFTLVFQMFIVVGGVTRLIPLTGLTTPFLSYGGSSLLANYAILALLVRISHSSRWLPVPRPVALVPLADAPTEMVPVAGSPPR